MKRLFAAFLCASLLASPALAADKSDKSAKSKPAATAAEPNTAAPTAPASGVTGEMIDNARQYHHCIALARQKPSDGWEEALAWASLGGGEPARHCGAVALIGLKQYEEGASRLEALARDSHSAAKLRAGMLAQAGQAWLLAGQPERAYAAQTTALGLVPDAPDLLVDRAESLAVAKNYKEAVADLNKAIEVDPKREDAYVYRATARRFLDDRKGAEADVAQALALSPNDPDAWLENGMLKRLGGDDVAARQAWLKVLDLSPSSGSGDTARRNIEMLDVEKVKQ